MANSVIRCIFCGRENEVDPRTKKPKLCECEIELSDGDEPMKLKATGTAYLSILCRCPNCDELVDIFIEVPEATDCPMEHHIDCWNLVTTNHSHHSVECTCPECRTMFIVDSVNY